MPENTVSVCRPGKWGNPHPVGKPCPMCEGEIHTRQEAVNEYEADGMHACAITLAQARAELRGKNLACFCPLDKPCHADVLLRMANAKAETSKRSGDSSPLSCSASITVRRGFEGWGVQFHYGVQHFDVGPQNFGMEREAEWMASMFSNALANMHAGNEPS